MNSVFDGELDKEVRVDNFGNAAIADCVRKVKREHEETFHRLTRTSHLLRRGKDYDQRHRWKSHFSIGDTALMYNMR